MTPRARVLLLASPLAVAFGLVVFVVAAVSAAQEDQDAAAQALRAVCSNEGTTGGAGGGGASGSEPGAGAQKSAAWTGEQSGNARTIIAVAKKRRIPARGAQIALATAMQESGLRNIDYGDRDSLGLFQQRPSQGWGSPGQVRNPAYAAGQFYDRLVKIPGWQRKPLTRVAQAVQRSAYPDAYAKWESAAKKLVDQHWSDADLPAVPEAPAADADGIGELGWCGQDQDQDQGGAFGDLPAGKGAQKAIAAARRAIGTPYVWGGGNQHGPTRGGYDCSGLTTYAIAQATGGTTVLPRTSQQQKTAGKHVPKKQIKPGDLIVFNNDGNWGHVGLYAGKGRMIHAPRTGKTVEEAKVNDGYWNKFPQEIRRVL